MNKELELMGIVLTKFDTRKIMNQEIREKLIDEYGEKVFDTPIRINIALAKNGQTAIITMIKYTFSKRL